MAAADHGVVTHIDLVRHGKVATPGLFCADPEEPLSAEGWQQLEMSTQNATGDIIISSPSRRCHEFANTLAPKLECPFQVEQGFREMDFGRWGGQRTEAIWEQDADLLQQLWLTPEEFVAPDGEALVDFAVRVTQSWQAMLKQYAGQRIMVFTHGGVIRVLLANALKIAYRNTLAIDPGYGTATRMRVLW